MANTQRHERPTLGVLAGWQYYWTASSLSYLDPIYRGIRQAARELNCNLLFACGMGPSAASSDPLRPAWPVVSDESDFVPVGPWNTEGLIIINPLHSADRARYVQEIKKEGHPVIFIGSGEEGSAIVADNVAGVTAALSHLVEHGHQSIAFIAGSMEDMEGDTGDRLRAYRQGVKAFGLRDDSRLAAFGRHVYEGGRGAMREILAANVPFTAVLASNDESAFGAIQVLRAAGRSIPHDVAVIGFDDRPESAVQLPPLTSVHVPLIYMGYQAVERLLAQLENPDLPSERYLAPTRLVVRESCGCTYYHGLNRALDATSPMGESHRHPLERTQLSQEMAAALLAENRGLGREEVEGLCLRLIETFMLSLQKQDPATLRDALQSILARASAARDDAHGWQAALSILREGFPHLLEVSAGSSLLALGYGYLDEARVMVSTAMRQQHRQFVVDQRLLGDRVGLLTARLLISLDEDQVYDTLARHLPAIGIGTAWVGLFEAEGDDPVAWTRLRAVTAPGQAFTRIRTRSFPPEAWTPPAQPFHLALLPLTRQRGGSGFIAFEAVKLDVLGAIAQQMAGALNTALLYREATEGRRLAEEADRMKSRFLSTVSHELRTPLNLIVGTSGLLLRDSTEADTPLPAQVQQDVERIHANALHLGRLIDDVLDLASSDAGQLRLAYDYVDLAQVLRMAAETGRQLATDKGLRWRQELPESGPLVWGDRTRLQQVILNLISNAVKFTEQGEVRLVADQAGDTVTVSVYDTGMGLPLAEQAAIFGEFKRSERSIRQGYAGIGLGLAICKRLVELHDGGIGVHSSGAKGAGSVFYFTLPTASAQVPASGVPQTLQHAKRILVLGAEADSERLCRQLEQRGLHADVIPMQDSANWLAQLLAGDYRAVLLDISQGGEHAWQALKLLKTNPATQYIPALFCSTSSQGGIVLELEYLTKPIEVADLTRALDQHWLAADGDENARTFLVVDDDAETLELHTRIIQAQARSNRVLRARHGREALEILEHTPVDLVLLDLMMPELDGFCVLEAMQADKDLRDIPVIVITGQVLTEAEMERLNRGVATVMSKGLFDLDETLAHLEAALGRKQKLSEEAQRTIRKAMVYIHEHYMEEISRHDLAHYVGMSEDYLTFCFRQELGMTPVTYLNRYRVAQAKTLLSTTDRSITDIALDVGYGNSAYFSRVFKREVGIPPTVYRQQQP